MSDFKLTLNVKGGKIESVETDLQNLAGQGTEAQSPATQAIVAPDSDRLKLAEASFKSVLDADVHQDNKASRILGGMAFLTSAAAAIFAKAFAFTPPSSEFVQKSTDTLGSYISQGESLSAAVADLKKAILGSPVEIAGLNGPLLAFSAYLFLVVGGAVLYLIAIGPSFNIGGAFHSAPDKVKSVLFFQFIGITSDEVWKKFWRPTVSEATLAALSKNDLERVAQKLGFSLSQDEITKIQAKEFSSLDKEKRQALEKADFSAFVGVDSQAIADSSKLKTQELSQRMADDYIFEAKKISEKTITKANLLVFGSRMFKWALPLLAPLVVSMFSTDPGWFLLAAVGSYFLLFLAFFIESVGKPQIVKYWGRTFAVVGAVMLLLNLVISSWAWTFGRTNFNLGLESIELFMLLFFAGGLSLAGTFRSRKLSAPDECWSVVPEDNKRRSNYWWPIARSKGINLPTCTNSHKLPTLFWLGVVISLLLIILSFWSLFS
ncbi:MAG TPA: hypothetical protein VJ183_13385 [Chloroflexia bacterium]|nr:hypothetical protein [Chloroflexia bacterium]